MFLCPLCPHLDICRKMSWQLRGENGEDFQLPSRLAHPCFWQLSLLGSQTQTLGTFLKSSLCLCTFNLWGRLDGSIFKHIQKLTTYNIPTAITPVQTTLWSPAEPSDWVLLPILASTIRSQFSSQRKPLKTEVRLGQNKNQRPYNGQKSIHGLNSGCLSELLSSCWPIHSPCFPFLSDPLLHWPSPPAENSSLQVPLFTFIEVFPQMSLAHSF